MGEDFLPQFIQVKTNTKVHEGLEYFFRKVEVRNYKFVEVSKMDGSKLLALYNITRHHGQLLCTCPAGRRGVSCKHRRWLEEQFRGLI